MTIHPGYWLTSVVVGLLFPLPLHAGQGVTQVPIHGFTGTIATPESVDRFYTDLNKGLEKTGDAFDRVSPKHPRVDSDDASLESLRPGTPVAVRYSWADNPDGNLYNAANLPASPFRTDAE